MSQAQSSPIAGSCCARLPLSSLPWLGPLRAQGNLRVLVRGVEVWLFWSGPDWELAREILALPGVQLYGQSDGQYHRPGEHLPIFDVPDASQARSLPAFLSPAPVVPEPPPASPARSLPLVLIRDDSPRPTTLLRLPLARLVEWADQATTYEIEQIQVARREEVVLVRGRLPALVGDRYWGERVLIPVGFRLGVGNPDSSADWKPTPLTDEMLRQALCLQEEEIALVGEQGAEVVPLRAFGTVTRASLRQPSGRREPPVSGVG